MNTLFLTEHWLDWLALAFFAGSWWAYAHHADHAGQQNLLSATNRYRLQWMREMLSRENRTIDAIMVGNLSRSITFFANTTIFILLGLMTLLGYGDKASKVLEAIPFVEPANGFIWELKIFVLIIIFIYAFFKYSWSMRQYNYAGIYIAAAPPRESLDSDREVVAQNGAWLIGNAARHFNNGLRAYYFGLAALAWFVHPLLFLAATGWVLFVTHRREYRSGTLSNLNR